MATKTSPNRLEIATELTAALIVNSPYPNFQSKDRMDYIRLLVATAYEAADELIKQSEKK